MKNLSRCHRYCIPKANWGKNSVYSTLRKKLEERWWEKLSTIVYQFLNKPISGPLWVGQLRFGSSLKFKLFPNEAIKNFTIVAPYSKEVCVYVCVYIGEQSTDFNWERIG